MQTVISKSYLSLFDRIYFPKRIYTLCYELIKNKTYKSQTYQSLSKLINNPALQINRKLGIHLQRPLLLPSMPLLTRPSSIE